MSVSATRAAMPGLHRPGVVLAGGAVAVLVGYPLLELFAAAGTQGAGPVGQALSGARGLRAVTGTLVVGVVATAAALLIGTVAALATERSGAPGRTWLRAGMLLPLFVPSYVSALAWAQAYGPAGISTEWLGWALPGVYGPTGVVTVVAIGAVPLTYLAVAVGLATRAEPDLERAARASGAGRLTAWRTITLPLLSPSAMAGAALAFIVSVNSFGVPAVLGMSAGFSTVTTRIYSDLVRSADPEAFTRVVVLSTGLLLLTLAVVGTFDIREGLRGGLRRTAAPAGGAVTGRGGHLVAAGVWMYVAITTGAPLVALTLMAMTRAVGLPRVPANWTLDNFREALDAVSVAAFGRSAVLAVAAATVVLVLGSLLTALRHRGGRAMGTAATLTFAAPGSALAVGVLLAYGRFLRDTLLLILIAYLAKFWALGHRVIAGAADGQPPELAWAARSHGADAVTTLRTVTVPLMAPALAAAWLLVFRSGLHELTMSSLLYGPGSETLAVTILNLQQLGDVRATTALAVMLTAVVLGIAGVAVAGRGLTARHALGGRMDP